MTPRTTHLFSILCMLAIPLVSIPFRITYFTSKACRQCTRFDRKYKDLVKKYPGIEFNRVCLEGEGFEIARSKKIDRIPMMVFEDESGREEARFTGVPENMNEIISMCKKYSESCMDT